MKKSLLVISLITAFTFSTAISAFAVGKPSSEAPSSAGTKVKVETKTQHFEAIQAEQINSKNVKTSEQTQLNEKNWEKNIKVQGKNVVFDVPPIIIEGRTLIPVRAVTESLGATVNYEQNTKEVAITKGHTTVIMTLGSVNLTVNGEPAQLDVPAQNISNRAFVPLRFLATAFGEKVLYDAESGDIFIGEIKGEEILDDGQAEELSTTIQVYINNRTSYEPKTNTKVNVMVDNGVK